ncbi:hypothetical protein H0H93_000889 [Arthromyces matolae]|nr:hypothetical protein H0H93_000889 [Arthromyces matolae]
MGARQMVNVLRQDHLIKVPEDLLLAYFREFEPEAVQSRKQRKFRRKRFWAAGVMDILSIDQHDKWKRFGLWLHLACDPYPGRIAWLKIWWCNRNTRLLNSFYIGAGREVGGVPLVTQSDRGKENNGIANMHTALRHRLDPSLNDTLQHRWCIDKSNIKAEALWSQLRRQFTPGFENILDKGINEGLYDPLNPLERIPAIIDLTQPSSSQVASRTSKRLKAHSGLSQSASEVHPQVDFTTQRLSDVLRMQRPPRDTDVQTLFLTVSTIHASVRRIESKTLLELLELFPSSSNSTTVAEGRIDYQAYLGPASNVVLHLDFSSKKQRAGGFKISSLGTSSIPLFGDSRGTGICAKQTYYRKERMITKDDGQMIRVAQNIPHDGRTQAKELTVEIACLVWAGALLRLVYRYIESEMAIRGNPPFNIPQFRFVEAALAIEQVEAGKEAQVFLLEEVIGGTKGPFRKYLNNVSPVPLPLDGNEDQERGEFLAFTQHVQYFRTKKKIFVSDYQGGDTLLTDPQIVTDRLLGPIFADGNVPATHDSFEANHRCNKFCDFFKVPVDYDLWESSSSVMR